MIKSAIYYTVNQVDKKIMQICQDQIRRAFKGNIVSVSTEPIRFGRNVCLPSLKRSVPGMVKRILVALLESDDDIIFFLEDDVLYHPSHFDFTPPRKDIYYYNVNNWRWDYPNDRLITYDYLKSLSGMCCYKELAINHYQKMMERIIRDKRDWNYEKEESWARSWGYEPGTKPIKKGGFSDEEHEIWKSEFPNIDIRHTTNFTKRKTRPEDFKHLPDMSTWKETTLDEIPGWNLKEMFI